MHIDASSKRPLLDLLKIRADHKPQPAVGEENSAAAVGFAEIMAAVETDVGGLVDEAVSTGTATRPDDDPRTLFRLLARDGSLAGPSAPESAADAVAAYAQRQARHTYAQ